MYGRGKVDSHFRGSDIWGGGNGMEERENQIESGGKLSKPFLLKTRGSNLVFLHKSLLFFD